MHESSGMSEILSLVVSLIIVVIIAAVAIAIYFLGLGNIKAQTQSVDSYVTQTEVALTTGNSYVSSILAPSLQSNEFMAQFYGGTQCIGLLNELALNAKLKEPNDPSSLSGKFFVCVGDFSTSASFQPCDSANCNSQQLQWLNLPVDFNAFSEALPNWLFPYVPSTINGTTGRTSTLTYEKNELNAETLQSIETDLNNSCTAFFNAYITGVGNDAPSAFINSLSCVALSTENGNPVFISYKDANCQGGASSFCTYNPILFLHGSPGGISNQLCTYQGGWPSILCAISPS